MRREIGRTSTLRCRADAPTDGKPPNNVGVSVGRSMSTPLTFATPKGSPERILSELPAMVARLVESDTPQEIVGARHWAEFLRCARRPGGAPKTRLGLFVSLDAASGSTRGAGDENRWSSPFSLGGSVCKRRVRSGGSPRNVAVVAVGIARGVG